MKGLLIPSPSAPIPADRQADCSFCCCTSEALELHIRLEWVRRSSGREQTDTDHRTPQPSQSAQQKKVKSQGNERGGKLGGVAPPLFWGRVVPPPKLPTTPLWARVLEPWKLGRFGRRQSVNNREPSNRPITTPVQQQSAATTSKQPATSRQTVAPQSLAAASNTLKETSNCDQHLCTFYALQPPRFSQL